MRTKTLTNPQRKQWGALKAELSAAQSVVLAAGPDRNTRFSDCYALASAAVRSRYDVAGVSLRDWEYRMIADGRGWWNSMRHFTPY